MGWLIDSLAVWGCTMLRFSKPIIRPNYQPHTMGQRNIFKVGVGEDIVLCSILHLYSQGLVLGNVFFFRYKKVVSLSLVF